MFSNARWRPLSALQCALPPPRSLLGHSGGLPGLSSAHSVGLEASHGLIIVICCLLDVLLYYSAHPRTHSSPGCPRTSKNPHCTLDCPRGLQDCPGVSQGLPVKSGTSWNALRSPLLCLKAPW